MDGFGFERWIRLRLIFTSIAPNEVDSFLLVDVFPLQLNRNQLQNEKLLAIKFRMEQQSDLAGNYTAKSELLSKHKLKCVFIQRFLIDSKFTNIPRNRRFFLGFQWKQHVQCAEWLTYCWWTVLLRQFPYTSQTIHHRDSSQKPRFHFERINQMCNWYKCWCFSHFDIDERNYFIELLICHVLGRKMKRDWNCEQWSRERETKTIITMIDSVHTEWSMFKTTPFDRWCCEIGRGTGIGKTARASNSTIFW